MKSAAAFMLAFLVCFLTTTVAFGQYRADQGKPGTQGPWPIAPVAPWAVVGPDAGIVPVTLPVTQTGAFGEVFTAEAEIPLFLSFPYNVISPEAVTVSPSRGSRNTEYEEYNRSFRLWVSDVRRFGTRAEPS